MITSEILHPETQLFSPLKWLSEAILRVQTGLPQVLVSVVGAKGSTPRDEGARMLVSEHDLIQTIGGGHLEYQAIALARQMLKQKGPAALIVHYALGPSLGQCCGGAVSLAFEHLSRDDLPWLEALNQQLQHNGMVTRQRVIHAYAPESTVWEQWQLNQLPMGRALALNQQTTPVDINSTASANTRVDADETGATWEAETGALVDRLSAQSLPIVLCGAGHVGKAIVRVLANLPVQVTWLDPRDSEWPAEIPDNVQILQGDADDVVDCPDNACWLVLTHSHALDLEIIEQVFKHRSFLYLGLIGSKTKCARFRSQLRRRFDQSLLDRLTCPIGLVETSSKLPDVIAVSVVAQLLPYVSAFAAGR